MNNFVDPADEYVDKCEYGPPLKITDESEEVERELEDEIAKEIACNRKQDEIAARMLLSQECLAEDEILGAHLRYENINHRSSPKPI